MAWAKYVAVKPSPRSHAALNVIAKIVMSGGSCAIITDGKANNVVFTPPLTAYSDELHEKSKELRVRMSVLPTNIIVSYEFLINPLPRHTFLVILLDSALTSRLHHEVEFLLANPSPVLLARWLKQ
uniref:Uncharacterized protein n=1 Tax=Mesocestoides corti TaxID=53468 RepID=A0A5K3FIX5_MESCO